MSEQEERWRRVTSDVHEWVHGWVDFARQAREVRDMPDVSDFDKQALSLLVEQITQLFGQVSEMTASRPPDLLKRLIASYERMHKELSEANRLLAGILFTRKSK